MLLIFIFLSGIFALNTVPRQENPELAQRWSIVQTIYPGASPARVETQILEPMEAKLREVYELNEIISFASQGFGTTVIEIKDDVSPSLIEQVWSEVQDKLDQSLFDLPEGLKPQLIRSSGPPTTLLYSLTWNGEGEVPLILLSRIAEDLRQSMAYVAGSDRSAVFGSADEEVLVEVDNAKLSALGLTFQEVAQSLSSLDTKKPIGQISNNGQEFLVKSKENLTNLSEVSNLPIKVLNEYEIIRLGDIANLSKNPRRMLIADLTAGDNWPLMPPMVPSIYSGKIVSGKATRQVRFREAEFELPKHYKADSFFGAQGQKGEQKETN